MAQTPAVRHTSDGDRIDYTPVSAVTAGDVVVVGSIPMIAERDIAAGALGSLACEGVWKVPKATGAITAGDSIYWDADGSPVTGDASSGAATGTATGNNLMGVAQAGALSGDSYVYVLLTSAQRTATIAGSVTADDITGSDSSLAVAGLGAAQGGAIAITGGTSSTSGNAGGAVSVTGGTPGATGAGGAVTVTGGAGGATSGTGGAVTIAAGAGTAGNANGGALTLRGGNAHGSGTDGAIAIGDANTASVTFGVMPRFPVATVAAAGNAQGNAAALAEGINVVTGPDDTKGVVLPTAVAGMVVIVKVGDGADLKVYPATGGAINALSANAAMTVVDDVCFALVATSTTQWYTLPLLPS
jgi:predicted RecA/RadA family phage recombinase